ncbi:putative MATE family efflux protein [Desulfobaculum xiamenense]|uniref:Multidrug-efflux transporter n=1 Tax=Desulfobaculum xiamenense TaxID=995050 RepID=A0A846QRU0_9BACT|nr:MATE family efflux transporter [Desulfobaculum xiamenense]NJB69083.1 putative MATE family efflux protein [Desulfobaculum xiamenense]
MTDATPYRTIWKLSWPQIIMMFFHFWIGFIDVYVAGKLDSRVQAALGIITSCLFFLLVIAVSVANGSVAAISQSEGGGLHRRARRYVGLCLELALAGGIVIMGAGLLLRDQMLAALRVPQEISAITGDFLQVYALLLPPYYLLLITNAVFRARKEVMYPLYAMIMITVVNTVADFGLGLGLWGLPNLGHKGLAWATFWSVSAGTALNLYRMWRKGMLDADVFPPLRWIRRALPYLFRVAWPSGLMQILWQTGYLVLFAITASLPVGNIDALAGMTAGIRVESLLFLPGFAFNMTASVLVGNSLGAGRPDEARRYGLRIWAIGATAMSLVSLVVWQFVRPLAAFLTPEAAVQAQMIDYLLYNMLAIPFTLTSMILGGAFNGAGATWYNMWIFAVTVWCLRLPMAYTLGHHVLGNATGVWMSQLASQMVQAGLLFYFFTFGNWQRFAMVRRRERNGQQGASVAGTPLGTNGANLRK